VQGRSGDRNENIVDPKEGTSAGRAGEREVGEREGGEREGGECEEPSTHVIDNADGTRSTTVTKVDGTKVGTVLFYLSSQRPLH
jgi:hypothetical protein